jgi:uncharacterized protein (TIGR00251 family)
MMDISPNLLKKCIINRDKGLLLSIEVKPGSKTQGIDGVNQFRGCLVIRVKSVANKGKANLELIQFLSEILSLPASNFEISKGATSRKKRIKLYEIIQDELIEKLTDFIND